MTHLSQRLTKTVCKNLKAKQLREQRNCKLTQHRHARPSHLNSHDLLMIAVLGRWSQTIPLVPVSG